MRRGAAGVNYPHRPRGDVYALRARAALAAGDRDESLRWHARAALAYEAYRDRSQNSCATTLMTRGNGAPTTQRYQWLVQSWCVVHEGGVSTSNEPRRLCPCFVLGSWHLHLTTIRIR